MSVASDLASAFERELTVPVRCGDSSTRAFFNRAGSIVPLGTVPVQVERDTLFIQTAALNPDLKQEAQLQVGALGDDSDDEDAWYRVTSIELLEDGLMQSVTIAGGAE